MLRIETTEIVLGVPRGFDDAKLISLDSMGLQYFYEFLLPNFIEEKDRLDGHHAFENITRRYGTTLTSKAVRYALLYSYCFRELGTLDTLPIHIYLDRFYVAMRDAIRASAFDEVFYGSYLVCLYGLISDRPFDDLAAHARGFLVALQELMKSTTVDTDELFFMRCLCKDIFSWLTGRIGHESVVDTERTRKVTAELFLLAELAVPSFSGAFDLHIPVWMQTSYQYMRRQMVMYRLQIYLNYYLTHRSDQPRWDHLVSTIDSALTELKYIHNSEKRSIRWLEDDMNPLERLPFNFDISGIWSQYRNEWLLWGPSLLTHYTAQFHSFLPVGKPSKSFDVERTEIGFSTCRLVKWVPGRFKMNSLSALQGLLVLIASILTELQAPEGHT